MKKDRLSSWTLAFSVILIAGGLIQISSPEFSPGLAGPIVTTLLGVVLAIVTWRLRVSLRREKEEAEAEAGKQEEARKAEEEQKRSAAAKIKEEEEARRKAAAERFVRLRFPVAGVTFRNEDGTDRQKILREIYLNEDGKAEVEFDEDDELGDESGIRVLTELGCVGFIRRRDKSEVRRFYGKQTHMVFLDVEHFESDDGQRIYRADVCINLDREDPDQQWYFYDLSEH